MSGATATSDCACEPGYLEISQGVCEACPFGGECCLCKETAGCYDAAYGDCDLSALMDNFREHDQSCETCFSGTCSVLPRPGYEYDVLVDLTELASESDSEGGPGAFNGAFGVALPDGEGIVLRSAPNRTGGTLVACNTMAAGQYKDTMQNKFEDQNCLGGPNNTCAPGAFFLFNSVIFQSKSRICPRFRHFCLQNSFQMMLK